jgi:hypothetical protein
MSLMALTIDSVVLCLRRAALWRAPRRGPLSRRLPDWHHHDTARRR